MQESAHAAQRLADLLEAAGVTEADVALAERAEGGAGDGGDADLVQELVLELARAQARARDVGEGGEGAGEFNGTRYIAFDSNGNIYVTDYKNGKIVKFNKNINHNGDMDLAKELILKAKNSGCDAVKFQKRDIESVYSEEELNTLRESPFGTITREQKEGIRTPACIQRKGWSYTTRHVRFARLRQPKVRQPKAFMVRDSSR